MNHNQKKNVGVKIDMIHSEMGNTGESLRPKKCRFHGPGIYYYYHPKIGALGKVKMAIDLIVAMERELKI